MTTPRQLLLGLLTGVGLCFTPHASAEDSPTPVVPSDVKSAVGTTLVELLSVAEASSPTLRQFAIEIESTRGKARQAGLYPNPVASGGATQIAGPQSQYFAALSQEIVTRGKLQLSQAAVCREVAQAEFRYVQARFELLTAVRQGYFVSLAAQRRMEISNRLVEIAKKSRLAAKRAQQAGAGTLSDTLLLEIEFEKAEVTLENTETKWQASQQQLVATMGRRDFQLVRIHGDLTESLKRFESQVLIDGYVPYNAEVQSAEQDVEQRDGCPKIARLFDVGRVVISVQFGADEQVVHPARADIDVEMADQSVHAVDHQEHRRRLWPVSHQPDRQGDRQTQRQNGVERVKHRMHDQIQARRQVVGGVSAPQEPPDRAAHLMHGAVDGVIDRFKDQQGRCKLSRDRPIAGRARMGACIGDGEVT